MSRQKDVMTTGEVARICNVAPRTVSKWFDAGQLRGYRIPGSKDRRIPVTALVRFMKEHNIPMDGLMSGRTRVLIVDAETEIVELLRKVLSEQANYEVRSVGSGFAAGLECEKFRPHVMLLDLHLCDANALDVQKSVRENAELQLTKIIGTSGKLTDGQAHQLLQQGFDGFVKKPYSARQIIEAIEDAVSLVY
jgi:excisionase family DNA binding protein